MQYLKLWLKKCVWLFGLAIFMLPSQSFAQSAPEGWIKKEQQGNLLFAPKDLQRGQVYTILVSQKQSLAGQNLESWADSVTKKHTAKLGTIISKQKPLMKEGVWTNIYIIQNKGRKVMLSYFAYPFKSNTSRLIIIMTSADAKLIDKYKTPAGQILRAFTNKNHVQSKQVASSIKKYAIPSDAKIGGALDWGRYQCVHTSSYKNKTQNFNLSLYQDGEYRLGKKRTGNYKYDLNTGQINISSAVKMYNDRRDPKEYSIYYRDPSGKSMIYAQDNSSSYTNEIQCVYAGKNQDLSPSAEKAKKRADKIEERRFKWVTKPGQGVKMAQIDSIRYWGRGVYRGTGYRYEDGWSLLLKDGWLYKGLRVSPADLDVQASRQNEPDQWFKWKRVGNKILELGSKKKTWKEVEGSVVQPAKQNQILNKRYKFADSISMGGFGGSAWFENVYLKSDGTFERSSSSIMGTGVMQSTSGHSGSTAFSKSKSGCQSSSTVSGPNVGGGSTSKLDCQKADFVGTYKLDDYTLELRFLNGVVQRHLFFFFGKKKQSVVIGEKSFLEDK